ASDCKVDKSKGTGGFCRVSLDSIWVISKILFVQSCTIRSASANVSTFSFSYSSKYDLPSCLIDASIIQNGIGTCPPISSSLSTTNLSVAPCTRPVLKVAKQARFLTTDPVNR